MTTISVIFEAVSLVFLGTTVGMFFEWRKLYRETVQLRKIAPTAVYWRNQYLNLQRRYDAFIFHPETGDKVDG